MDIKDEVSEFLHLYAKFTDSNITQINELIHLEFSPVEKRKHLLSQIKFCFSKEICDHENAELLTVTNRSYQAILEEAKTVGVISVGKSFEINLPIIMLNYLVKLECQNHLKEKMRQIALNLSDYNKIDVLEYWTETSPADAINIKIEPEKFIDEARKLIISDISETKFKFEDEMERRRDRERKMIQDYYQQYGSERANAANELQGEIDKLEKKMGKTKSMATYNKCKKEIKSMQDKIVRLNKTKAQDLENINNEFNQTLKRIEDLYKIEIKINLLNALIVLPTKPS